MSSDTITTCAACGKEGDSLKACTACFMVKYCNRDCQVAHRPQHKKACKKRAVELHDEKLFQAPPTKEDCPICMLPMPLSNNKLCHGVTTKYMPCCGKTLCSGCAIAEGFEMEEGNIKPWCSLCRVPLPESDEEIIKRYKKRMELNDAEAFNWMGLAYFDGTLGLEKDINKAFSLWDQAAELGSILAYFNFATEYHQGETVEKDMDKALHYYILAAIGGHEISRHFLGLLEKRNRNKIRAMKHFMIAARAGYDYSLKEIGEGYKAGYVTKDDYATTLRAYQKSADEMKSKNRDIAAESIE